LTTWRARMPRSATTTSGYCGGPPQWPDVILRTTPRAFLGAELARGRKTAGFSSQDALAARLGFDRTLNMSGVEDVTAESRSLLRRATVVFDLVRGDALPRTASRALITEAAQQWKTR
jgi:hypothetical protein